MADIAGQSVTFTCFGGPVLVIFIGSLFMAASQTVTLGIRLDAAASSLIVPMSNPASGAAEIKAFTLFGVYQPAAGVHTWQAQWQVSAGTVQFAGGASVVLNVVELRR